MKTAFSWHSKIGYSWEIARSFKHNTEKDFTVCEGGVGMSSVNTALVIGWIYIRKGRLTLILQANPLRTPYLEKQAVRQKSPTAKTTTFCARIEMGLKKKKRKTAKQNLSVKTRYWRILQSPALASSTAPRSTGPPFPCLASSPLQPPACARSPPLPALPCKGARAPELSGFILLDNTTISLTSTDFQKVSKQFYFRL